MLHFTVNRAKIRGLIAKRIVLTLLVFFYLISNTFSQYFQGLTPPFDINFGLPHNEINDIVKDEQGYVWIATDNGVSRFDGYNFFNFNSTTHPKIFKNKSILKIEQQGTRFLLLTEGDGLIALDPKTGSFKKVYTSNPLALTISNDTTAILFDTGTLLFKVKNKTIFKQTYKIQDKSSLIIHRGNLYVSLNKQKVFAIDPKHPSKRKKIAVADAGQTGDFCRSKKYGIALWNGDVVRVLKGNRFVEHPDFMGKKLISFYVEEPHGENMYIERSRVPIVNVKGRTIALKFGGQENIQFKSICRINETCFLVSSNQGVLKLLQIPALSKRIDDFSIFQGDQMIVRRRIVEHKNKRYYLGYPYILVGDNDHSLTPFSTQTLTTFDGIIFNDELYCTTEGNGLISFDLSSKKVRAHSSSSMAVNETFESIAKFSDSLLVLAGGNKLVAYNPLNKREFSYHLQQGTVIHVVAPLKNTKLIYLGTNKGLHLVRLNSRYGFEPIKFNKSFSCDIRDVLLRTGKNEVWTATNQGVFVFDMKTLKLRVKYTTAEEISHPKVVEMIEDQNGNIWASTYSGLTVFDTKRGLIRFINKNLGIINTEYNYKSACLLRNGQMVFGGLNSYEMIDPSALKQYNYTKRLLISGIETIRNEKDKRFTTYTNGEKISFETGKEALKVYLTNLDFNFGYGYSFQYCLDGKNWFKTDKKNWILLSNLTYGDYTLKIRMYNPFGHLVDEKAFPLYVSAPFYVKSSFYILIFSIILVLVILFILYFFRSLRIKAKTQSKIAMDLHDESGTILTRLLLISKRKKFDESEIERLQIGLKEALYSFRTYLDSISRKKYALHDLNDELQEFVHSSCEQAQIQVKFDIETDKNYVLRGELFRDIKLSIYEIVTNCMKHSGADQLTLNFVAKNKTLHIQISDNGVCDLHELEMFKGNGFRNIRKRITRNRGRFSYYITKGSQGLTIEIYLPL